MNKLNIKETNEISQYRRGKPGTLTQYAWNPDPMLIPRYHDALRKQWSKVTCMAIPTETHFLSIENSILNAIYFESIFIFDSVANAQV